MGLFSGTANKSNPKTTGGSGRPGSGKNSSPHPLGHNLSESKNSATRALASKYSMPKKAAKLAMPVAGKAPKGILK